MSVRKGFFVAVIVLLVMLVGAILLNGCKRGILSEQTSKTLETEVVSPMVTGTPARTGMVASGKPAAEATLAPTQTQQPALPEATSTQAVPEATNTQTPSRTPEAQANLIPTTVIPCDLAVPGNPLDVSIPAGTQLKPGEAFVKTWRIANAGICTWTSSYSLVQVGGQSMADTNTVSWGMDISPGSSIEISVNMVAPASPGTYESAWMLRNAKGDTFGISAGSSPLVVRIQVAGQVAPTPTETPSTGSITGRVLVGGALAAGVTLTLEDQTYATIATLQTGPDGSFSIPGLVPSGSGYNLVFKQEANPGYPIEQVASWTWIGPVPLSGGANLQLPDFEVSYSGLALLNPAPDSSSPVSAISAGSPLVFEWTAYPGATEYWVDLVMGDEQSPVWQSPLTQGTTVAFDGTLFGGAFVQPGDYWWAVGARKPAGAYNQTIYTYLVGYSLEP